jgi:hypothetical protein
MNPESVNPSASEPTVETVSVPLGSRTVEVPKGGLYDRYRMDPDLNVIAEDPRVKNVDFFRTLTKTKVDSPIGETLTPNFYYSNSTARVAFLVKSSAARKRLPAELDPLEVVPGLALAFIMFFRYDVADIDFYTEAAVGVAVRPARHGKVGFADLATGLGNSHLHAYVLSLPVNTDIAQVRGHDGYGFPKWRTDIDVDIDDNRVWAQVFNDNGTNDISLSAPTPKQKHYRSGARVGSLTSYTKIGEHWHSTLNQTNVLAGGASLLPGDIELNLGTGRVSDDARSLEFIRPVQFEVATEAQIALHMPAPISVARR